ncbi:hypothetical protein [Deinococcus sp. 12RED42]|uniref:hypothetical protein n=1 Tax=Deinococcus sp. 12RED42 TaxID=2745872 RepID=UPI001E5BA510|nr:hypothetical protein [Deinococcus sp. 12RED42]MCD0164994.1 hypothetical protein [Deinococcus sp. 12RED42]
MTAPSLPEALARLAQLLPSRVQWMNAGYDGAFWMVYLTDEEDPEGSGFVSLGHPANPNQSRLEESLRQECMARGWELAQQSRPHPTHPSWRATIYTPQFNSAQGSSPAHALALALVGVLGGEGA